MLKEYWKLFIPTMLAVMLVIFEYVHRLEIGNLEIYRSSIFVSMEFLSLICSVAGLIVILCSVIVSLYKMRWRNAVLGLVSVVITIILISYGLSVDSPTLIYMT